jgi:hypothetical protein
VHDFALKSIASEAGLNPTQQCQINASSICLRVISLSDISSFDGKRITQAAYDGMRDPIQSKIQWLNQQRPPQSWWDTWRDFLLLFSDANIFLLQPLGDWTGQYHCICPWKWYSTEDQNTILEYTDEQWFQHRKQGRDINKYCKERQRINHMPTLKARYLVLIHISSIERT